MLKLIFIDIDNTLLDFDEYVKTTLKDGFSHFGLKQYEPPMYDTFKSINDKLWLQIESGKLTFERLKEIRFNLIFDELGIEFNGPTFETYFREQLNESAIPVSGAYNMLNELSKNYILCAASNGPYAQQIHRLELANMDKYFSFIFVSEKVGVSKPHPGFFDYAFNEINSKRLDKITPEECLIIGDSMTSDIAGGRNYGMKTCLYRRDTSKHIDSNMVDYIIDSLDEITANL